MPEEQPLITQLEILALKPDGTPAFRPVDVHEVAQALRGEGSCPSGQVQFLTKRARRKWRLVLPSKAWTGPSSDEIAAALEPLTSRRHAQEPLYYEAPAGLQGEQAVLHWMESEADVLYGESLCLLIAGPLEAVPWIVQQTLGQTHMVGRLALSSLEGYQAYANKVVEAEKETSDPEGQALLFAPNPDKTTEITRTAVIMPLQEQLSVKREDMEINVLEASDAVKRNLLPALGALPPRSLWVAGCHGVEDPLPGSTVLGALCDHSRFLVKGADISSLPRCLERGIAVLFACNSAGASGVRGQAPLPIATAAGAGGPDLPAHLPVALLEHPAGPLSVLGHVDVADLRGFRTLDGEWPKQAGHVGLIPFHAMVGQLAQRRSIGAAMEGMRNASARHLNVYRLELERQRKLTSPPGPLEDSALTEAWISWNDTRGWVILGDPATTLGKRR